MGGAQGVPEDGRAPWRAVTAGGATCLRVFLSTPVAPIPFPIPLLSHALHSPPRSRNRIGIALNVGGLLAAPATAQTSRTVTRSISLARDGQVDPDTFTGSIDMTAWNQGRVKAKARVEGEGLRGSVQIETFSGDIELALPADAGFELVGEDDAFGNLDSDFALRTEDRRRISSGGGPRVKVETFSGALRLRKQWPVSGPCTGRSSRP